MRVFQVISRQLLLLLIQYVFHDHSLELLDETVVVRVPKYVYYGELK